MFDERGLFLRDLSEVHLLFDFISGRAGKSLDQLGGIFKIDLKGKRDNALTSAEVVEEICKIRYPPEGQLEANAEQAAFMVVVKDKLNDLAYPARGLTIAFTSMFAGTALEARTFCEFMASAWCFGGPNQKPKAAERLTKPLETLAPLKDGEIAAVTAAGHRTGRHPAVAPSPSLSREEPLSTYTAVLAFPNLEPEARKFRRYFNMMPWWGLLLVIVISMVSWDCSVTSTLMTKLSTAELDHDALFSNDNYFVPTQVHCAPKPGPTSAADGSGSKSDAEDSVATRNEQICVREQTLSRDAQHARINLEAVAAMVSWKRPITSLLHPVALGVAAYSAGYSVVQPTFAARSAQSQDLTLENDFSAVLGAFNTLLTPLLFGWLGTIVGVARSITSKVRDSILAPRDYQISKVSMLLGMSAGLTVGLFYSPIEANATLTKSLGGTISVSAATLSFLAGLGSEAFFNFADGVISRLFPTNPQLIRDDPSKRPS